MQLLCHKKTTDRTKALFKEQPIAGKQQIELKPCNNEVKTTKIAMSHIMHTIMNLMHNLTYAMFMNPPTYIAYI